MATKFEELVNGMVNISFGAAAITAERGKEVLESLSARGEEVLNDLNARGEEARHDPSTPDFARSMSDIFEQAGGMFTDVTERLSAQGATAAERILDELIVARVRTMGASERAAFVDHVRELVDSVEDGSVSVPVESVEVDDGPAAGDGAERGE